MTKMFLKNLDSEYLYPDHSKTLIFPPLGYLRNVCIPV